MTKATGDQRPTRKREEPVPVAVNPRSSPSWETGADVPADENLPEFAAAKEALQHHAARQSTTIVATRYHKSADWGYVLRSAWIVNTAAGRAGTWFICWTKNGKTEVWIEPVPLSDVGA